MILALLVELAVLPAPPLRKPAAICEVEVPTSITKLILAGVTSSNPTTGRTHQTSGLSSTPGTTDQYSTDPAVRGTAGHGIGALDQSAAGVSTGPDTSGLWAQGKGATGLQGTGHSSTLDQDISKSGLTRETGRTSGLTSETGHTAGHTGGVSTTSAERTAGHSGEHAGEAGEEGEGEGLLGKVKRTLGL